MAERGPGVHEAAVFLPGFFNQSIGGFLVRPDGPGPFPALVVVHEIFGLNDHVRDLCRRFAREGFVALAPDLWSREGGTKGETDLGKLRLFVEGIPDARMVGDLAGAAAFLQKRPEVRRRATGVVGFCMGGIYAFHLACEPGAQVQACVDFYGRLRYPNPTPARPKGNLERVRELRCPFLGIFGGMDDLVPLKDVLTLKEQLPRTGNVIAYPKAGHAFMNDTRPGYRPEEAADAWRRTVLFLREHLAPDTLPPDALPTPNLPPQKRR